jgi:hypothetical protein
MATAIELQKGAEAWHHLTSQMTRLWSTHAKEIEIAIGSILTRTSPEGAGGSSWRELVSGKVTLERYLRGLEPVAAALNEMETREGLFLTSLKRFYVEVVVATAHDAENLALDLKESAFPVWAGVVVVLVLVLAIKLT